jgi:hypothetical protein
MARKTYDTEFVAEYRGREQAREFTASDTGELVKLGEVLKLERQLGSDSDDVQVEEIRLGLDGVTYNLDMASMKRGQMVRVVGTVGASQKTGLFLRPYIVEGPIKVGAAG